MSRFVQTDTILDKILSRKVVEVAASRRDKPLAELRRLAEIAPSALDVVGALRGACIGLIAEVKRASPSRGVLIEDFDPVELAKTYADNGASMISVLTDTDFFMGSLQFLSDIRDEVSIPLLRKEFVIDSYQVYEARAAGADAVLLIAAALDDEQLVNLYRLTMALGMTPLLEVHNAVEMERVLSLDAPLIGINNRDLRTFDVDLQTVKRLAAMVPSSVTLVAESGMKHANDIQLMGTYGAHAVLIGEGLVTAPDIAAQVRAFSSQELGR